MTEEHRHVHHDAPQEGPIKTPKQLIAVIVAAFVVPIAAIILLVIFVGAQTKSAEGSDAFTPESIAERIRPVGRVEVRDVSDPKAQRSGEQVYSAVCMACHADGLAGAPKIGDQAAWAPRIKQGYEALLVSALKGKGAMPPQGGGDFSDLEVGRAVVVLANQSGAKFEEPTVLAAAAGDAGKPDAQAAAAIAQAASAVAAAAAGAAAQAAPAAPAAGAAVPALYEQACQICHAAGVAGAPKFGDKAAWAPRLDQGVDKLTASVVAGKGAMPPKGGSNASEAELRKVVEYMVGAVK